MIFIGRTRPGVIGILLLAVTLGKLALAGVAGDTADLPQHLEQARLFLAGADVFDLRNTGNRAYFFLAGHYALVGVTLLAADATGIPFSFWIKVPAILSDLGVCLLLRRTAGAGDLAAVAYIANPLTVLLSVHHGQMHSVATAVAVWALHRASAARAAQSGLLLGVAASIRQHFAVLIVPLVMRMSGARQRVIAGFVGVIAVVNLPLLVATAEPWRSMVPMSNPGIWGYSVPLLHGPSVLALAGVRVGQSLGFVRELLAQHVSLVVFAWTIAFFIWVWRRRDADVWHAALLFLLGIYVVTPAFGVQWLVWALPFWLVVDTRGAMVYSVLAGVYLAGTYWVWTFNARYGVRSITANLEILAPVDLALYVVVGALGIVAWAYCVRTAWRLLRERPPNAAGRSA